MDLLTSAAVPHAVWPVDIDETPEPGEPGERLVLRLAKSKVAAAKARCTPFAPILAADTVVVAKGRVLGKPEHEGAAREMLNLLSAITHEVLTGYHLRWVDEQECEQECSRVISTHVMVRSLTDEEIDGYLACEEWRGKAGGYAIQGRFRAFVRSISGSYENVVGLPLCAVLEDLKKAKLLPPHWPDFSTKRNLSRDGASTLL
jgi:septum formation protein